MARPTLGGERTNWRRAMRVMPLFWLALLALNVWVIWIGAAGPGFLFGFVGGISFACNINVILEILEKREGED